MKKNLIKILFIMLFLLTVSFTFVFDNNTNVLAEEVTQTEEVVEPSLNIYKKNISYSSEIYIMYAVSYEGIDASTYPVKMLFFNAVQDEYTTSTAAYVAESQGSANIVGVNCQIFASNGLAAKQMTDDIYARAYVEVEGQTIYSEVVKYSVLEYYHEIKEEGVVPTSILNLLEAMINYGAAAQINFNYNTEKLANATYYKVNVENAVLPDGFTSGRFKAEEQVTLTAPLKEGYVFKNWTNSNGDIVSTEVNYTLTVTKDETLTANYEEEVAVTPVTLTLTKEAAYDATADTLNLPTTVTFDYNNETVTENVTWDTTSFVVNQIGKQKLYGTLSNESYKVNEISIEIDVLPYTFSLNEETNEYSITKYFDNLEAVLIPDTFNNIKVSSIEEGAFKNNKNLISIEIPQNITNFCDNVFSGCSNLIKVYYCGTIGQWCKIKFSSLTSNPMYASTYLNGMFYLKNELLEWEEVTNLIIPESITVLNSYTFAGFTNVDSITLYPTLKMINGYAFSNCNEITNLYYYGTIENWCNIVICGPDGTPLDFNGKFNLLDEDGNWSNVTKIEIPNSITVIGDYQFANFCNIEELILSDNLIEIGEMAFVNCSNIESIIIPNSIINIGVCAFRNCKNLKTVYYNGTLESWCNISFGWKAYCENASNPMYYANNFYLLNESGNFENLNDLVIPESVKSINSCQFSGFRNIEKLTLHSGIEFIGLESFYNCVNLKTIYNLSSLELSIGLTNHGYVAYYAKYIHNELPREIELEKEVAYDATVDTLDLPQSVTFIYNEEEITQNVTWDTSTFVVNQIGEQVIYGTFSDDELYDQYNIKRGGIIFTIDVLPYTFSLDEETNEYAITKYYGNKEEETIPETFNSEKIAIIGQETFKNCISLTSITIPSSLTSFGNSSFYACNNLLNVYYGGTIESWCNISFSNTYSNPMYYAEHFYMKNEEGNWYEVTEIVIPNTITEIDSNQFYGFENVTSIIIPESVTSIESCAFGNCSAITSIEISENVQSIGIRAFENCSSLMDVYYRGTIESWCNFLFQDNYRESSPMYYAKHFYMKNEEDNWYEVTEIVIPNTITKIGNYQFCGFENITRITIPNSVTSIEAYAFSNCRSLINIEIPDSVISIGTAAFRSCESLINITIPESVTGTLYYTFANCSSLTSITIPSGVTKILDYAFSDCESLEKIIIPEGVTSIGRYAFYNCSSLSSVIIPSGVTSIEQSAFELCINLTDIEIPESVTNIGGMVFYSCKSLTSIEIPESVTSIGYGTFYSCDSLTNITIPESVTSIDSRAFAGCKNLINIEIPEGVTTIKERTFAGCSSLTSVKVPNSVTSIDSYAFNNCNKFSF